MSLLWEWGYPQTWYIGLYNSLSFFPSTIFFGFTYLNPVLLPQWTSLYHTKLNSLFKTKVVKWKIESIKFSENSKMQFRWSCKMDANESICVGNIILISLHFQFAWKYLFRYKFWMYILSKQRIQISHQKVIFLATESYNWAFVVNTVSLWNQWLELEIKGQKLQFSRENIALENKVKASALKCHLWF